MTSSTTPPAGNDFVRWVEEKSDAVLSDLGDKFPPVTSGAQALHGETTSQRIEEVLLGHEAAGYDLLEELAALEDIPPLSEEELTKQALSDGGADADPSTPE